MLAALTLGGALGMHASGKKNERAKIAFLLCFHCSLLTDLVGEGKGGQRLSALRWGASVFMPADREGA